MSELAKEKLYRKELIKAGATGNNNLERIRSLAGGGGGKTLGQDFKDYVESLTNPVICLSPEFEGFLQNKSVEINKAFVLGDISEGLNGAFYMSADSSQNVHCKIMGGDTSIGYGEGASQHGGVETLEDLLSVDGGIWTCFTNRIQWKDLDKTINLSITIGGTNYEIKDISLDEIKTFIKSSSSPK